MDLEQWDSYLKEYQAIKKEREENGDVDNLYATGDPEWDIIHEKYFIINLIYLLIFNLYVNKIHQCKFRSNDMRKKFRKSLRLLDQMRSQGHRDEALMENKGRSFLIIELFLL